MTGYSIPKYSWKKALKKFTIMFETAQAMLSAVYIVLNRVGIENEPVEQVTPLLV